MRSPPPRAASSWRPASRRGTTAWARRTMRAGTRARRWQRSPLGCLTRREGSWPRWRASSRRARRSWRASRSAPCRPTRRAKHPRPQGPRRHHPTGKRACPRVRWIWKRRGRLPSVWQSWGRRASRRQRTSRALSVGSVRCGRAAKVRWRRCAHTFRDFLRSRRSSTSLWARSSPTSFWKPWCKQRKCRWTLKMLSPSLPWCAGFVGSKWDG
mmetsp:Transcript_32917/g.79990  ORF Transcript_32917/g.79990 Transcript_32917/m.79990 type:complete len:212 (-) Transcript_32917:454-1089(-)